MVSTTIPVTRYGSEEKIRLETRVPHKSLHTNVGGRTPVLQIAVSFLSNMAWHTNGCSTVGNTRGEVTDMARLVTTGQTQIVVFTIHGNMLVVPL